MESTTIRIDECASDIAYSLGVGEDGETTIANYLHQYFHQPLSEHAQWIDNLFGDIEYDPED